MDACNFRLYWNHKQQWVEVYLWDVTPGTFERRGGGKWAYYLAAETRSRTGLFGSLHFVRNRVRADVVAHELVHLLADYLRDRDTAINVYNEERIAMLFDGWVRAFWREYGKVE
jgi:hypothetical protein